MTFPFEIRVGTVILKINNPEDFKQKARTVGKLSPGFVQTCDLKDPDDWSALEQSIRRGLSRGPR